MTIAQLSPTIVVANPTNVNPLAHSTYNVAASVAGTVAQQKTVQAKSDSVNISRQALEKAAQAEADESSAKGKQAKDASKKTSAK